jgi:ArpU family phage transcriptional regulator
VRRQRGFKQLDIEQTAINADQVLSQYQHHKAMAKRWDLSLQSPKMDGMPKSPSYGNTAENSITSHLDDKLFSLQCERIIREGMTDERLAKILEYTYLKPLNSDYAVMMKVGYEKTQFYEQRKIALCAFAELWPPFPSELVVYQ